MSIETRRITLDEFHAFEQSDEYDGRIYELIDGEIIAVSPNYLSSNTAAKLIVYIGQHLVENGISLDNLTGADGGYIMPTGEEFNPDVAYIDLSRLEKKPGPREPIPIPPDFAVEVISPSDMDKKNERIEKKLRTYLQVKIPLLWYVYAVEKRIKVYAHGEFVRTAGIDDVLDGGDVLPGLSIPVKKIFSED